MDHTSLTSKFDLPPPKKKIPFIYRCFIHPPPKWVPIEWPQLPTLQACGKPSKAAWTGLFDKLRELELGVCHPRFRNGNRVEKTGAHFTNPKKKKRPQNHSHSVFALFDWILLLMIPEKWGEVNHQLAPGKSKVCFFLPSFMRFFLWNPWLVVFERFGLLWKGLSFYRTASMEGRV